MVKILLTVPVYNEEKILYSSMKELHDYVSKNTKEDWEILIADNGSTDKTREISDNLARTLPNVKVVHLRERGKARALKYAWENFRADIYAYCDADLATDVNNLKELFNSIIAGNNLVIGSRYIRGSDSKRPFARWLASMTYIFCVKMLFNTKIHDFQCGFKAIDNKIVKEILPQIKDNEWFFDTELILLVEYSKKYRIKELPVKWREKRAGDSRVNVLKTGVNLIKNLIRLKLSIDGK